MLLLKARALSYGAALSVGLTAVDCTGRIVIRETDLVRGEPSEWNSHRTGTTSEEVSPVKPSLELVWKERFLAGVSGSMMTVGSGVLVPFLNGEFALLDLATGKQRGMKRFGRGPIDGLTMFDDKLYFTLPLEKKQVRAYDVMKGEYEWKTILEGARGSIAADSLRIYLVGQRNRLYSLSRRDGTLLWEKRQASPLGEGPAVYGERIFYADRQGTLICRDGASGELLWRRVLTGAFSGYAAVPYGAPVVVGGQLFVTTLAGGVYALRIEDGKSVWERNFSDPIYAPASVRSGTAVILLSSGRVVALDAASGETRWVYDSGALLNRPAAFGGPFISVATAEGDILLLSAETGAELVRGAVDGRVIIPPVIASPYLLLADDKKWIYAFRIELSPAA